MATAADYPSTEYRRSSSFSIARSPDTASPIYPERAIRPLPKNRLKSKLSPEQVSTIVYPPDPPPISPTLSFSVQENGSVAQQPRLMNGDAHHLHHHNHHDEYRAHPDGCTCGGEVDSGDEDIEFDHPDYRYTTATIHHGAPVKPVDTIHRRLVEASRGSAKPPPPGSTASSGDGYESFENTSNKKKRKIPNSGISNMHQSQLSAEMANMGIGGDQLDGVADDTTSNGIAGAQHHSSVAQNAASATTGGSGTGISGAGRGRYGRQDGKHRRPLASSTMNNVIGYGARGPRGGDVRNGADTGIENTGGIISQAIKTAAEQGPLIPSGKGRENGSLLQSAASANAGSNATPKTKFTFTCESDSATKMVDQQAAAVAAKVAAYEAAADAAYANGTWDDRTGPPRAKGGIPQNQQMVPPHRGNAPLNHAGRPPHPPNNTAPAGQQQPAPPLKPKPRRNPNKEYAIQAANRKKQQQYQNYHHRPKPDDMWVCEFCEYEDLFGEPPYAMIRRYEIKDRQERKKAAEKRRLLEKAKMKGRKNKKGSGKGGKNNNTNNATAPPASSGDHQNYDPNLPPPDGEDFYEDDEDYADEYEPMGPDEQYPQDYSQPLTPAEMTGHVPGHGGGGRA